MARGGSGVSVSAPLLPGGDTCANRNIGALRRVLCAGGLYVLAVSLTIPSRPALMLSASGGNSGRAAIFIGVLDAVQSLVTASTGPVLGSLADGVGRVPILNFSAGSEAVALLLVALFSASLVGQFVAYMIIAATGAFVTTIATQIADLCPSPVEATRAYGQFGAVVGAAFMVGPALGGVISKYTGDVGPFFAASVYLLFLLPFVSHAVPETRGFEAEDGDSNVSASWWTRVKNALGSISLENPVPQIRRVLFACPGLRLLVLSMAMSSVAQSGLISIVFLYVNARLGWGAPELGAFISATGFGLLLGQGVLAPILVRTFGEKMTIVGGCLFGSVHYVIYALAGQTWIWYAGLIVAVPAFAAEPATKAVLARQVISEKQGELQGSLTALNSMLRPLGTLGCTAIFALGNKHGVPGAVFYVISALSLLAAGIANAALMHPELK